MINFTDILETLQHCQVQATSALDERMQQAASLAALHRDEEPDGWRRLLSLYDKNEPELIRRLRWGDTQAILAIYEIYKHDLVTLGTVLLMDRSAAEDVVYNVFVTSFIHTTEYKNKEPLKKYLCTCVTERTRHLNRHIVTPEKGPTARPPIFTPKDHFPSQTICNQMEQILGLLTYDQREVLVLHVLRQEPFEVVAAHQKDSVQTVQDHFRDALQKLKEQMAELS